jgi:type III pantothenate kinase
MTLLIDAGNSAVKWGLLADGRIGETGWLLHRGVDDLAVRLAAAMRAQATRQGEVVGCHVAGEEVVRAVEQAVQALGLGPVDWLRSQDRFDRGPVLVNGYRDPAQLGVDRWHAMLGGCTHVAGSSFVVASAGTATTVDCVRAEAGGARFVGGCIAPGVRLMLESLAHGTAGLPRAEGDASDFPDNTDAAIMTGVLDAQAGLVERVLRRFSAGLDAPPRLLLAGGHAEALRDRLPRETAGVIEHNLVLRGLALRASGR